MIFGGVASTVKNYFRKDIFIIMSQLDKLKQLAEVQKNKKSSSMITISDIVCINVGIPVKPYFRKVKDAQGNNVKDEDGNIVREKQSSGYQISLVEFGTGKKVMAVFPRTYNLELLKAYVVSGDGYDIKAGGMYFLEKNCTIKNYE